MKTCTCMYMYACIHVCIRTQTSTYANEWLWQFHWWTTNSLVVKWDLQLKLEQVIVDRQWDSSNESRQTFTRHCNVVYIVWVGCQLMMQQQWMSIKQNPLNLLVDITSRDERQQLTCHQSSTASNINITDSVSSVTITISMADHSVYCTGTIRQT